MIFKSGPTCLCGHSEFCRYCSPDYFKAKRSEAALRKAKREAKRLELKMPWAGKRVKRVKLPSMKKVKAECWKALSLYVRARDAAKNDGLCLICSKNSITLSYHIWPASSGSAAKWNPLGIVGACGPCNYGEFRNRAEYALRHIELFGLEMVASLRAQSKLMTQFKRHDFLSMTADFTARLAALKGESSLPK